MVGETSNRSNRRLDLGNRGGDDVARRAKPPVTAVAAKRDRIEGDSLGNKKIRSS